MKEKVCVDKYILQWSPISIKRKGEKIIIFIIILESNHNFNIFNLIFLILFYLYYQIYYILSENYDFVFFWEEEYFWRIPLYLKN